MIFNKLRIHDQNSEKIKNKTLNIAREKLKIINNVLKHNEVHSTATVDRVCTKTTHTDYNLLLRWLCKKTGNIDI